MKTVLALAALAATLGGCAVVPLDYGYRGDRGYYRDGYGRDRYYSRGYYYRDDGYYYRRAPSFGDHGQ